jgi:uncharacterized protein YcfJ
MLLMTLVLTTSALARSNVGDWQTVQQDIPRGWQITVETSFAFPCIFEQATNDELLCRQLGHAQPKSEGVEIRVPRERIREIRVERREGANMLGGGLVGAALGSGFGAILAGAGSRGASAYLFGLLGAKVGAHSGARVHILHGKVIYRRVLQAEFGERANQPATARSAP